MAASHSYLSSPSLSSFHPEPGLPALGLRPQLNPAESFHLVHGVRRALLLLYCPFHAWNWPRLMPDGSREGFDAHQTCFKCNTQRLYNTSNLTAGPLYRTRVPGSAGLADQCVELAQMFAARLTRSLSRAARVFGAARSQTVS
jgi:hypothetical protein